MSCLNPLRGSSWLYSRIMVTEPVGLVAVYGDGNSPFIFVFICLFIYLFIYLFVYLFFFFNLYIYFYFFNESSLTLDFLQI